MKFALAIAAALTSGCATFGATLPPGAAGGSFLEEARGAVPFTAPNDGDQRALDAAARAHVDANVDVLMALRAESLETRAAVRAAEKELHAHVEERGGIDHTDLERIRDLARRYLELDALLYALWTSYRDHLPYRSEPDPYAPMRAATLLSPATREAGGMLALAAELVRLDNASVIVETLGPYHALTRFLNRGDEKLELPAEGFDRCVGALTDPDHRSLIERQLRPLHEERQRITERANGDARVAFLLETIVDSATGKQILDENDLERRFAFTWAVVSRSSLNAVGPLFDLVIAAGYVDDP